MCFLLEIYIPVAFVNKCSDMGTLPFLLKWIVILFLFSPFNLMLLFHILKQATIAERANAFRRQCELAETMKLKEINLYTPVLCFYHLPNLIFMEE